MDACGEVEEEILQCVKLRREGVALAGGRDVHRGRTPKTSPPLPPLELLPPLPPPPPPPPSADAPVIRLSLDAGSPMPKASDCRLLPQPTAHARPSRSARDIKAKARDNAIGRTALLLSIRPVKTVGATTGGRARKRASDEATPRCTWDVVPLVGFSIGVDVD